MRIKLKKGKQKELIERIKKNHSWKELSLKLNLAEGYIRNEIQNEEVLISNETYKKICSILNDNCDKFIEEELSDNWGRSKGGRINNGKATLKDFNPISESEDLAEFIGILLGDGHIEYREKSTYSIRIAGHFEEDYNFLSNFVSSLTYKLFNEKGSMKIAKKYGVAYLVINGKNIVKFLLSKELQAGNKKKNNQGIPDWIKYNDLYLKACLRGLIDTDGSIHKISKERKALRINFTNYADKLLNDVRDSFIKLGYSTSKIISGKQIFITKKEDVARYISEIGFKNEKHLNRVINFQSKALVV